MIPRIDPAQRKQSKGNPRMPKFLESRLEKEARRKGFTGKRADKYVFGAMNNMGAMHGSKETAKGAAMQRKHEAKFGK